MGEDLSDGKEKIVIRSSRHWVPDEEARVCRACKVRLWKLRRKHHCRRCCYVFCWDCTRHRVPVIINGQHICSLRLCKGCLLDLSRGEGVSLFLLAHSDTQFKATAKGLYFKNLDLEQDQVFSVCRNKRRNPYADEAQQIEAVRGSIIGMVSTPERRELRPPTWPPPANLSQRCLAEYDWVLTDDATLCSVLNIGTSALGYYMEVQKRYLSRSNVRIDAATGEFISKVLAIVRLGIPLCPLIKAPAEIKDLVRIKKVPHGRLEESEFYKGLAFTKTFPHKLMIHSTCKPKILVISFPIDYAAVTLDIVTIGYAISREKEYKSSVFHDIKALSPHMVFSSCSVSHDVIEALAREGIQIMPNLKRCVIRRISILANTPIVHSANSLSRGVSLGMCSYFHIMNTPDSGKTMSILINDAPVSYFSIVLRGPDPSYLSFLKKTLLYMMQVYCNLVVECSLAASIGNSTDEPVDLKKPYVDYPSPTEKHFLRAVTCFRGGPSRLLPQENTLYGKEFDLPCGYSVLRYCYPSGEIIDNKAELRKAIAKVNEALVYCRTEHKRESFIYLTRSANSPSFCFPPRMIHLEYYGKEDTPIGELIASLRSSAPEMCPAPNCGEKLAGHLRYYISSSHKIVVSLRKCGCEDYSPRIKIYVECPKCAHKTQPSMLSMECLSYSFGKFLGSCRYCTPLSTQRFIHAKECKSSRSVRYVFSCKNLEILVQYDMLKVHTLSLPPIMRSVSDWMATHTKLKTKEVIKEMYSYFIMLVARSEEIRRILCRNQDKRDTVRAFLSWIFKETDKTISLVGEKMSTVRKARRLRLNGYFSYLVAARVRNCEAALAAYSGNLLDLNQTDSSEEMMLCVEHLHHIDTKFNPLSPNSVFKLRISPATIDHTIAILPYTRWSNERSKSPSDGNASHSSTPSESESSIPGNHSGSKLLIGEDSPEQKQSILLLESTRVPHMFAVPRELELSSIIALALNSKHYSVALSRIMLKNHITPKTAHARIRPSRSIPLMSNIPSPDWKYTPGTKDEFGHITYEDNINGLYVRCKVMYAAAFDSLRRTLGEDKYYIPGLLRCYAWNRSGGKSDSRFFKTADGRYVLKEVSRFEQYTLCEEMPKYLEYIRSAIINETPTLLAVPLGAYCIHYKGVSSQAQKMDLIVMRNIFYGRNVSKVSTSRPGGFSGARGPQPVLTQILTCTDIRPEGICKESAHSPNQRARGGPDGRKLHKMSVRCRNAGAYLGLTAYLRENAALQDYPLVLIHSHERELMRAAVWNDTEFLMGRNVMDYSLAVGISNDKTRMVVGILDYMRTFTWDKRLENWVKESSLLNSKKEEPTIVSPGQYGTRFRRAIGDYIVATPGEYSSLCAGILGDTQAGGGS